MAVPESKSRSGSRKLTRREITFKCRLCEKQKPLSEMKLVRRFRPAVIVCQDCEKDIQ